MNPPQSAEKLITQGLWGQTPWQFIASQTAPTFELCTAAFCIVTFQGKLVLVEHISRGHEFTGGHVDPNESIIETVTREVREESLAVITQPQLFGYKKVSPPAPIPHRDHPGSFYPFPHSYIPYYFAEASQLLENEQLTPDIKSVKLVSYQQALELLAADHNHHHLLDYLLSNHLISLK